MGEHQWGDWRGAPRSFPFWQLVPPETAVRDLAATSLLMTNEHRTIVCGVTGPSDGNYFLKWSALPEMKKTATIVVQDGPFKRNNWALGMGTRYEMIAIPPVQWSRPGDGMRGRNLISAITALATLATTLLLAPSLPGILIGLAVSAGVGLLTWTLMRGSLPPRILTAGTLKLDGSNLLEYARARQEGQRPELLTDAQRRQDILSRIDEILTEYGALASDIVYRIENSALFDSAVPATASFQVASVRYQTEAEGLSLDELDVLATELEITYSVARDHAETVGLAHLPSTARPDARRAAKAARLALDAGTDGEREAAMQQVTRILTALALYYLPAPDGVRKQLTDGQTPIPDSTLPNSTPPED